MKIAIEVAAELQKKVRANDSVANIFGKTIATLYRSMRDGLIDQDEYQAEFNKALYRCSLMVG